MAGRYANDGIDELIFIDTVASLYGRNNTLEVVERTAERLFLPMTVGGGIQSLDDVEAVLRVGADKVTLNSAAVRQPSLITDIAERLGSQCVVAAIEAKRASKRDGWDVYIENAREPTGLDVVEWAKQVCALGAGELLLTSIDADGTRQGCDLALIEAIAKAVTIPLIASGGPGEPEHVGAALMPALDAIALGTLLHFGLASVSDLLPHRRDTRLPMTTPEVGREES